MCIMSSPMFTKLQTERLFACLSYLTLGWLGVPDLDSGITSHHVHSSGCSLIFFIYLTSHQPTSPSARAMQQPRDKNGIITISFKTPLPLHFHLSQVFLVPNLSHALPPSKFPEKNPGNWPTLAGLDPSKFKNSPPIRRTLTHVAPVCRTALDLRQDLQTSMVDDVHDLDNNTNGGDIFQKGWMHKTLVNLGNFQSSKQIMSSQKPTVIWYWWYNGTEGTQHKGDNIQGREPCLSPPRQINQSTNWIDDFVDKYTLIVSISSQQIWTSRCEKTA